MGRPRKLNLSQDAAVYSNVTICVAVEDISIDSDTSIFSEYTFYTDCIMYNLPSVKAIIKQIASILKRSEEHVIITRITI